MSELFPNQTYSANTLRLYTTCLHNIQKYTGKPILEFINDGESTYDTFTRMGLLQSSISGYAKACNAYAKSNPEVHPEVVQYWKSVVSDNYKQTKEKYSLANQLSEKQVDVLNNITWHQICSTRDSLPLGSIEQLLLAMYTLLPPVRADYYEVSINSTSSKNNLIIHDDRMILTLTDFKTAKTYEVITHTFDSSSMLFKIIQKSLLNNPRTYLFVNNHKLPFSRNSFVVWASRILNKLFKQPMSITDFRHLYISSQVDFNKPTQELQSISNLMGHSIPVQKMYQWHGYIPYIPTLSLEHAYTIQEELFLKYGSIKPITSEYL